MTRFCFPTCTETMIFKGPALKIHSLSLGKDCDLLQLEIQPRTYV